MITTTQNLIDRTRRTYYANYPSDDATLTDNEILLHINDAVATVALKQVNENYAVTGLISVPEGYITTFDITSLLKDSDTGFYSASIPHPPFGFPENSGIQGVFFAGVGGQSRPVLYVGPSEVDYFRFMQNPPMASYYWIEGSTIFLYARTSLPSTYKLKVRMATHVTSNLDAPINLPPDAVDMVYTIVLQKLTQRKQFQSDDVIDGRDK